MLENDEFDDKLQPDSLMSQISELGLDSKVSNGFAGQSLRSSKLYFSFYFLHRFFFFLFCMLQS